MTITVLASVSTDEVTPYMTSALPTIDPEFESRINALKRYVDTPAITYTTTMQEDTFAEDEEARFDLELSTDSESVFAAIADRIPVVCIPFLDQLADLVDRHADRVLEFPRLVYSDELDGELLRNITLNIRFLVEVGGSNRLYVSRLVRRLGWMRKWAWTIVVIMEHITSRSGLTFRESELLLVSVAPTMHAFVHALFHLGIDFPDFFLGFQNVISTVTKFHPIYTLDDDSTWYIRLTPEFRTGMPTMDFLSVYPLDVPDMEFFVTEWGEDFFAQILHDRRCLVQHIHRLLLSPILSRAYRPSRFEALSLIEPLALTMHTLRYLKEFRPEYYQELIMAGLLDMKLNRAEIPLTRIIQIATLMHDHTTIRGIMEHFHRLIRDDRVLLTDIVPIDNMANRLISIRRQDQLTEIPFYEDHKLILISIANLTRFQLAGTIELGSLPIMNIYEALLATLFHQGNGIFWFNRGEYYLTETAMSQPLLLVGIGRLFGLIVKHGNRFNILGRYISASPTSTLLESLFFSSEEMRKGFYDVFLPNCLDTRYQSGYEIAKALDTLGREIFVF